MWLFEIEIGRQARIALRAADALDLAASRPQTDFDGIFGAVQALLAAAANISKMLWPVSTRATRDVIPRRGETLRARLAVAHESPLRDRRLRNHFEHFDERLESFIAHQTMSFADVLVGAAPGSRPDYPEQFYFRRYDPERNEVAFSGETVELNALTIELRRLASLIAKRHPIFGEGNPPAGAPW